MSNVRECFVCGTGLGATGKPRVEVVGVQGAMVPVRVCVRCWERIAVLFGRWCGAVGLEQEIVRKFRAAGNEVVEG